MTHIKKLGRYDGLPVTSVPGADRRFLGGKLLSYTIPGCEFWLQKDTLPWYIKWRAVEECQKGHFQDSRDRDWLAEEGVGSPGTGVTDSWELSCGCWEMNLNPLKEQPMLLMTGLSSPSNV